MLKFKTSCAVPAYLSSNLLNEVGLSLFRYFEVGLRVCDIVVNKFTFAISSPDEFLFFFDCVFDVCCFIVLTLPRAYNKDDDDDDCQTATENHFSFMFYI